MKKLFFVLLLSFGLVHSLEAQWCGCPCLWNRYENPWWVNNNSWYYGYYDINEYPYTLPVNIYFNPRPSPNVRCFGSYRYVQRCVEQPRVMCPKCRRYH